MRRLLVLGCLLATRLSGQVPAGLRIEVAVADSTDIVGLAGAVAFNVSTPVTASFRLRVTPVGGGEAQVVDSLGTVTTGTLHFAPAVTPFPQFPNGAYRIEVLATSPGGESARVIFNAVVVAPTLTLDDVPAAIDPRLLMDERMRPSVFGSVVSGLAIGGMAYAAGRVSRPPEITSSIAAPSGRSTTWAVLLASATVTATWLVHPGKRTDRVKANNEKRADFKSRQNFIISGNNAAIQMYRGLVLLTRVAQ